MYKKNLIDDDSRYLLVIIKPNLSQYLILNIIKDVKEENKIIYHSGSLFEDDIYNEAYSDNIINKIKFYLEHDIILVLKIYPQLMLHYKIYLIKDLLILKLNNLQKFL